MTNKTKIIIIVLVVIAIVVLILGIINNKKTNSNVSDKKEENYNMFDYINNMSTQNGQVDNTVNNTEVENNVAGENTSSKNNIIENNNIIGREEQESKNENTEANDRKTAIELAKKEWNISVDSYNFEAELKGNGIYEVSVRNKTDGYVNTVYTVNVKTGTVTE